MNNIDKQYQALLQDILDNGVVKKDRTGTGTISVFGRQIRHKMSEGFPLLTTKKMAWKTMVTELLWFLRGDTNIKFLLDYDCHIWDGDAYQAYLKITELDYPLTKEEFIKEIKTNNEFAKKWGELGPIYGKQWRQWQGWMQYKRDDGSNGFGSLWYDQILRLVHDLKTNPDSRRLMVNAWNVGEIDQMVLPPCHYGFQVYTRELNLEEKWEQYTKSGLNIEINGTPLELKHMGTPFYPKSLPQRAISLMFNMRSIDTPLGLPFNIASYGLLLEIIAKEVNMVSDELIGNLGDCHIYKNQIDGVKEQITREPFDLPKVEITERNWYQHQLVKEHLGEKTFSEKILSYRPDCFVLKDYISHPKIYFPLSN
jgi:thymidylate synthase